MARDEEFIQVRLSRRTRERLRDYSSRILKTGRAKPANPANSELSPEDCVTRLLDCWEVNSRRRERFRKKSLTREPA
jgi:hypothetical protein